MADVLLAAGDAQALHDGSVCSGSVTGTITATNNTIWAVEGVLLLAHGDIMNIPSHIGVTCLPPPESHNYPIIDTINSIWVTDGVPLAAIGAVYPDDHTYVANAGSNTIFIEVT